MKRQSQFDAGWVSTISDGWVWTAFPFVPVVLSRHG